MRRLHAESQVDLGRNQSRTDAFLRHLGFVLNIRNSLLRHAVGTDEGIVCAKVDVK